MNVLLEPESRLTGTVLDEAGKPVAGARIMLSWGMGEMMNVSIEEKDGRYLADGLGSGKYRLGVLAGAGPWLFSELVELKAGKALVKDIRVKVKKPAAAEGR